MAFVPKEWKARLVEFAGRRTLTNVLTGASTVYDVARNEGAVSQEGDAFSAANMNDLETRISTEFGEINKNMGGCVLTIESDGAYITYTLDGETVKKKLGKGKVVIPLFQGGIGGQGRTGGECPSDYFLDLDCTDYDTLSFTSGDPIHGYKYWQKSWVYAYDSSGASTTLLAREWWSGNSYGTLNKTYDVTNYVKIRFQIYIQNSNINGGVAYKDITLE